MKKLLSMFCALAVALSLSVPAFAMKKDKAAPKKAEAATSAEHGKAHEKHAKKKGAGEGKAEAATSEEHGKAHEEHAKKKGADEGKKAGQQETSPSPKQ